MQPADLPFVATIFVGSFLLFLVQPMIARMALPRLGGAPAVWNSAMLVYQALLLAGYAYAHWLGRAALRRQAWIHLALFALAALTLPIGLVAIEPSASANPFLWVPWLLVISIGPLFFVISAQAPLIQRWYAHARHRDPYPLYAASNLGSFAGLLAYPLAVEPLLAIRDQRGAWSAGYVLLALLVAWCALRIPSHEPSATPEAATGAAPGWRERVRWITLAAVPSGLILSTTLHITTDIIAMPLLWVLPLGVYLLSFTLAFAARRGPADVAISVAPLILLLACFAIFVDATWLALAFCGVSNHNQFTPSVALHIRLFETRPPARDLTLFYLMMSVGGVLGGLFCALVAPLIFDWTYEHLLLLVAAAWLMRSRNPLDRFVTLWEGNTFERRLTIGGVIFVAVISLAGTGFLGLPYSGAFSSVASLAILAVAILAIGNRVLFACSVASLLMSAGGWQRLEYSMLPGKMTRSFFGIYSIRQGPNNSRLLVHGTTVHGIENLGSPARERMVTTYYVPLSGVGLAMRATPRLFGPAARIGVVGLGTGTLACYARPGQQWTFYEIDPAIVRIARDRSRFGFLSDCKPDATIELGDARLLIERDPPASADLLVIDAFSSDAVPMHLLTREAFADYRRKLSPRGLLLVHISNRFLDLKPVVAAAAAEGGWNAAYRVYNPDAAQIRLNQYGSNWIALSPSAETIDVLKRDAGGGNWEVLSGRRGFRAWTDDHASVLPLIKL
jgi:SAM-dependent methyltransferase